MTWPRVNAVIRSPFLQVAALLAVGVVAFNLLVFLAFFLTPPPRAEIYGAPEVARAFLGQDLAPGLTLAATARRPGGGDREDDYLWRVREDLARRIAAAGGPRLAPQDIQITAANARWRDVVTRDVMDRRMQGDLLLFAPMRVAIPDGRGAWRIVRPEPRMRLDPVQQRMAISAAAALLVGLCAAYLFSRRPILEENAMPNGEPT